MVDDVAVIDEEDEKAAPAGEPAGSSTRFLADIKQAEKAFQTYQDKSDSIDKLFANLSRLAGIDRDREFALFWANIQVLAPATYARPPVAVVVPKFNNNKPVPRTASEMLERCTSSTFDAEDIDEVMRQVRDDMCIASRGVVWVRYETKGRGYDKEKACVDHLDRKDFLHEPSRKWKEVGWAARRAWLTRGEMRKRFKKHSGDAYKNATYSAQKEDRDNGAADQRAKAGVWEVWHKDLNKVVWVTPGVDVVLDENPPHLTLEGFFPCPKPAYGTLQRRSLVPVPEYAFIKDQLEQINELTARIASLTDSVRVRGFYPAGVGDIGDAIEAALKTLDDNTVMIGVSNWALLGNNAAKDMIVWMPIEQVVKAIAALVEIRRTQIDDVYQISGLSDIMRGVVDPNEKLGQSELKSQYGTIRIRDKQNELVRVARDVARIVAEIIAENFSPKTMLAMSQMELPTNADMARQEKQVMLQAEQQVKATLDDPQFQQQAAQNPKAAKQRVIGGMAAKVRAQVDKLKRQPTQEQVFALLRAERIRPFVLDIETDSTIQADENREKQLRAEFMTALGATIQQLVAFLQVEPTAIAFAGEVLKFALAPFRGGRALDLSVDELIEQMKAKGGQQKPSPQEEAAKAELALKQADAKAKQEEAAFSQKLRMDAARQEAAIRDQKAKEELAFLAEQRANAAAKHAQEMEKGALEIEKRRADIAALRAAPAAGAEGAKPPSESINFKDLPPDGQVQMAAQAGITITPAAVAAEQNRQQAVKQAEQAAKEAAKPKPERKK